MVVLSACAASSSSSELSGLTIYNYNNTALAGEPVSRSILNDTSSIRFGSSGQPSFSNEITGTVTFPSAGLFDFQCTFQGTTLGFVWIDGHLVCQDGNAYNSSMQLGIVRCRLIARERLRFARTCTTTTISIRRTCTLCPSYFERPALRRISNPSPRVCYRQPFRRMRRSGMLFKEG